MTILERNIHTQVTFNMIIYCRISKPVLSNSYMINSRLTFSIYKNDYVRKIRSIIDTIFEKYSC